MLLIDHSFRRLFCVGIILLHNLLWWLFLTRSDLYFKCLIADWQCLKNIYFYYLITCISNVNFWSGLFGNSCVSGSSRLGLGWRVSFMSFHILIYSSFALRIIWHIILCLIMLYYSLPRRGKFLKKWSSKKMTCVTLCCKASLEPWNVIVWHVPVELKSVFSNAIFARAARLCHQRNNWLLPITQYKISVSLCRCPLIRKMYPAKNVFPI